MKSRIKIFFSVLFLIFLISNVVFAKVGVVNGLTHEKIAKAGETYERIIVIKNFGVKTERIKVYQTDYFFYANGSKFYYKPGGFKRSNASWITFYPRRLEIPPQENSEVKCVIAVPKDETLSGTYWSMIMVEIAPKISTVKSGAEKGKALFGVKQVMRYGIQIVTHINDTGTREIKFLKMELLKQNEERTLQIDIENTGGRWLRPFLWIELYDEMGNYIGKFEGGRLRIYPETSVRYRVELSKIPEGKYKALVIVDNKDEYIFGAEYSFNLISSTSSN